jgi:RNA polymerase sigma factor (sigma-70 family)
MTARQQQLVLNNMNMVYEITKPYKCLRNYEDILSEGMLGLCNAATKFEPIRGNNFSTFAYMHILGRCLNFIHTDKIVKPKRTNGKYESVVSVNLSTELENTCRHAVEVIDYSDDQAWLFDLLQKELTKQQFSILLLLYSGYKRKDIVTMLSMTVSQVYTEINFIKNKLNELDIRGSAK